MSDTKVDEYYLRKGREHVAMLFDKRFLNDQLSREAITWLEEYMGFLFQSDAESTAKVTMLTAKMRERNTP